MASRKVSVSPVPSLTHGMILLPIFLLIAVTLQSPTNLTAETCHGTPGTNDSVEFRVSLQGKNCSYDWQHNGTVIAHGGERDEERNSMEHVVAHTSDFLILEMPLLKKLKNISYKSDCQLGVHPISCIYNSSILDQERKHTRHMEDNRIPTPRVSHPDGRRRHHYVDLVPVLLVALLFFLIVFRCCSVQEKPKPVLSY